MGFLTLEVHESFIVDRIKELIKYKGYQSMTCTLPQTLEDTYGIPFFALVSPVELENLLLTHPQVLDVAVVGVKDTKTGNELPRLAKFQSPDSPTIALRLFVMLNGASGRTCPIQTQVEVDVH